MKKRVMGSKRYLLEILKDNTGAKIFSGKSAIVFLVLMGMLTAIDLFRGNSESLYQYFLPTLGISILLTLASILLTFVSHSINKYKNKK
ncbi:hypothetical protein [Clostridium sp. Cult1]|uniref:hypothetical protein n=1 Tax=Clostridium sp. Cult1 TaxID=2079002 RepID=UPI001F33A0F5|nr:hypothetical protein [Clostridium sp. Cult1]MCF6463556.1 hypothetical protein [Clostridium sp. Cult1]